MIFGGPSLRIYYNIIIFALVISIIPAALLKSKKRAVPLMDRQITVEHNYEDHTFVWERGYDSSDSLRQFIQEQIKSQEDLVQTIVIDKQLKKDYPKENATFLTLCRNNELYETMETIQSIYDRITPSINYDWVFLNDKPFDEKFIYTMAMFIPQGKISFGQIPREQWSYPEHIDQSLAARRRAQLKQEYVLYAESESYRHMCRFFLGFFYNHALMQQYQYYWRVEPGTKYCCNIDYDPFQLMRAKQKKYGFTMTMLEYKATIRSLWEHFKTFTEQYGRLNPNNLLDLVQNNDEDKSYNLCHFWSNFEIADLSIFRNPDYQAFFDYLDSMGGFFYERWGDAPVHTLAILWFLSKDDIWWFNDFGYYHSPYYHCPASEDARIKNRCFCDSEDDFTNNLISCTPHFLNLLNT